MARELAEMLEALRQIVDRDDARRENSLQRAGEASALGRKLPWVHRTGKHSWKNVFERRRLVAAPASTTFEHGVGISQAVYFFVGACAYPRGIVALLLGPLTGLAGTFAPYDTGGLKNFLVPTDPTLLWDDDAKTRHLAAHVGRLGDVTPFVGPYLAAHFRSPLDYVRAPRKRAPDFSVYHGLVDKTGSVDRLSWTVEVQVHDDVGIAPDGLVLQEIWLDHHDLWDELPDDFKGMARFPQDGVPLEAAVAERIEERARA
jgi:hypothetical protein